MFFDRPNYKPKLVPREKATLACAKKPEKSKTANVVQPIQATVEKYYRGEKLKLAKLKVTPVLQLNRKII